MPHHVGGLAARYILNFLLVCTCMIVFVLSTACTASRISGALKKTNQDKKNVAVYTKCLFQLFTLPVKSWELLIALLKEVSSAQVIFSR